MPFFMVWLLNEKSQMAADSDLVKILGVIGTALTSGVAILSTAYLRARRDLAGLRSVESRTKRDVAQDETDSSSLKLLLESATQWKNQYEAAVARETRYRRLLAVAEAKMRRFAEQAARDRDEDRRKIESLARRVEAVESENRSLHAQVRGRREGDAQ